VCCLKEGGYFKDRLVELGVPVYENLLRHRFDAFALRGFEQILHSERPDLIYTFSHPNTVIFSYLARMRGLVRRVVVSYHAMSTAPNERQVAPYLRPLLRRMDALLAVADIQKEHLARVERLPVDRIRVIHNGVDTGRYRPATGEERARVRRSWGFSGDEVVVAAVASLKPLKRIDALLRAAAGLTGQNLPVRLLLVGDGPERASLASLARELAIAERVVFAGVRDDVDVLLRAADVFVLSSRTEAFPNVILEAMATALPVVTTDVGSVREMVEEGRNALVVPAGDDAALAAALGRLVADPATRGDMGRRGREIVEARFRFEAMCTARESLFDELLSHASVGRAGVRAGNGVAP
jgi:glycosyltransferase involved in cell wall biosynthesis